MRGRYCIGILRNVLLVLGLIAILSDVYTQACCSYEIAALRQRIFITFLTIYANEIIFNVIVVKTTHQWPTKCRYRHTGHRQYKAIIRTSMLLPVISSDKWRINTAAVSIARGGKAASQFRGGHTTFAQSLPRKQSCRSLAPAVPLLYLRRREDCPTRRCEVSSAAAVGLVKHPVSARLITV